MRAFVVSTLQILTKTKLSLRAMRSVCSTHNPLTPCKQLLFTVSVSVLLTHPEKLPLPYTRMQLSVSAKNSRVSGRGVRACGR